MNYASLATAYQILAMVERPNRLKALLKRNWGSLEVDLAIGDYARKSLLQNLKNAGIREDRDTTDVFAKMYALLDRIGATYSIKVKKNDRTRVVNSIPLDQYHAVHRVAMSLNRINAPTEAGSFELSEVLLGVLSYLVAFQTNAGEAPVAMLPVLKALKAKGAEYMKRGYPYDALVHDCVAIATRPQQKATIFTRSEYLTTHIAFEGDVETERFCKQNGYDWSFKLAA